VLSRRSGGWRGCTSAHRRSKPARQAEVRSSGNAARNAARPQASNAESRKPVEAEMQNTCVIVRPRATTRGATLLSSKARRMQVLGSASHDEYVHAQDDSRGHWLCRFGSALANRCLRATTR
jgi:hypothetical protein